MASRSNDDISSLKILGSGSIQISQTGPEPELLEAFPNRYPDRDYLVRFSFPEFTSLCPVTGQPDFGTILLDYVPDKLCVESKSFKIYLFAFRNHQSFMESITNRILDDLARLLEPRWIRVRGFFAPRGATRIHVIAEKWQELEAGHAAKIRLMLASMLQDN